ncbi:major facilitator superfamily domain-containing protein 12-like [Athalia rosae]|uniref:major facilitator superfamily domain-containing protein 12-like n=1 Tax=Athalia rosae TaxID=37344 RepID=UPI0020337AEB|nr:major facilitator superfamily domain-containing protein 12-like [Athalia rosae]XP_012264756.2 major facilitator superfamily domain-containing protein 12-like [Athalia rosae]XP_012264757.2 major facilitator superfamily domain-containing protein 12-like [Athalia rosae]XP_048514875.1 major facilitator superfamily domain-containing protein 12-like [Athalia rosae]XP_048514876.1 major facilitator superfamily domain-containing protein 12-like [Athalia rosae]
MEVTSATAGEKIPLILEGKISRTIRISFALGHVFNDLAAAMWFSYTLLYLQRIILFEPVTAGAMLLLGQIVDALMTPVFGILVDRYGSKKSWHIFGSVLVGLSFPAIFGTFVGTDNPYATFIYILSISVFQTGWAAVQISHLSMIPALARSPLARADLTAIRYSAQVGAAVLVFVVTWIILPTQGESVVQVTMNDADKFRHIVIICTAIGITATALFHIFLKARHLNESSISVSRNNSSSEKESDSEVPLRQDRNNSFPSTERAARSGHNKWSGTTLLLRVALLYVASRLFITLAMVYLPLYIEESAVGGKQALATVPLASYLASFVAALALKHINRSCGTKVCYLLGALIGILSCIITEFAGNNTGVVYLVAILIGGGSSITMVTSLSVTAELIGPRTERSALVYSVVTFLDKVVTGLVVILIEKLRCLDKELCPSYYRDTLSVVCASSMLLGLLALASVARCLT